MIALIATLAAALFGAADFLGGFASRREPALVVTIASQAAGFALLVVVSFVVPPSSWADPHLLWGIGAGASGGLGVLALYAGLATGRMSLVAPVTAALSGSIPAAVGLLTRDEPLAWTSFVGIALALAAVIIVSATAEDDGTGNGRRAIALGVLAGIGFAGSILCYAQTPASTGFAPLAVARVTAIAMLGLAALTRGSRVVPLPGVRRLVVATGLVDAAANIAQVTALRLGPLAVASVLGALYPVATLLLARFILHEHLHGWQRVGIALALAAVVLTALP
ncbi:MAG: DMT family transporter [Coriobacteriia bacterium]|nr:DMT family transporter [Coriobacteriia bacterium]